MKITCAKCGERLDAVRPIWSRRRGAFMVLVDMTCGKAIVLKVKPKDGKP